jgi:outer membrane protein OmpA-like peptidoglycan-associated protein
VLPSAILFGFDSARLTEAGRQALNRIQTSSHGPFSGAVRVEGHTCDLGDASYNLVLSAKRAHSVAAYLARTERFAGSPISTAALGEWSPAFPNDGDANRAANRRVELILTPADTQATPTP